MAGGLPRGRGTVYLPRTDREKLIGAFVFTRPVAFLTAFVRLVDLLEERREVELFVDAIDITVAHSAGAVCSLGFP